MKPIFFNLSLLTFFVISFVPRNVMAIETEAYFNLYGTYYSYAYGESNFGPFTISTTSASDLQAQLQQIGSMANFPLPLGGIDYYDLAWEANFPFKVEQYRSWEYPEPFSGITTLAEPYTELNPMAEISISGSDQDQIVISNGGLLQGSLAVHVGLNQDFFEEWSTPAFTAMFDYTYPVPEPTSMLLIASGLACLAGLHRRK